MNKLVEISKMALISISFDNLCTFSTYQTFRGDYPSFLALFIDFILKVGYPVSVKKSLNEKERGG